MTFDLPGIPYSEPCFANSARRDPNSSDVNTTEKKTVGQVGENDYHKDRWKKGMIGIVYEVTPTDYAHIIATEGGGSAYHDILVACHPVSSSEEVPYVPTTPAFRAHTLFAPAAVEPLPPKPGHAAISERFQRPDPSYAQASARYLNLLATGADELGLPQEYKDYLHNIRPYTITTQGQRLGQFVFLSFWMPFIVFVFALQRVYQDEKGRSPKWLAALQTAIFTAVWISYDGMFKGLFGDGERTMRGEGKRRYRGDEEWSAQWLGKDW